MKKRKALVWNIHVGCGKHIVEDTCRCKFLEVHIYFSGLAFQMSDNWQLAKGLHGFFCSATSVQWACKASLLPGI